jgi:hypothetical protein
MVYILTINEDYEMAIVAKDKTHAREMAYERDLRTEGERRQWLDCPCRVVEYGIIYDHMWDYTRTHRLDD